MPPLKNIRHELFALNIYRGMSQKDAAIAAGYKDTRAYETGSELVRNSKIVARMDELGSKIAKETVYSVQSRKDRLAFIAEENNPNQFGHQRQSNISAITELNKMEHIYEPDSGMPDVKVQTFVFIMPDGTRVLPGSFKPKEVIDIAEGE